MKTRLRQLWLGGLLLCLSAAVWAAPPLRLPVYVEDSHAGSFYWMVQNLAVTGRYRLILIDAHDDATGLFDSDLVRHQVLRAASSGALGEQVRRWRSQGRIQCFNWIEPLMPRPIAGVTWIPADALTPREIAEKQRSLKVSLNAHEMATPRQAGDLADRYQILDLDHFLQRDFSEPTVVSLDLDYFAGQSQDAVRSRLRRILAHVLLLRNLQAITVAVSRPYLNSEEESHFLLAETLRQLTRVVNLDLRFEPFLCTGEDRSERAKEFYRRGLPVPHYRIDYAPAQLRSLIAQNAARISVDDPGGRWHSLLVRWRAEAPRLEAPGQNGCMPADEPFSLRLGSPGPVSWKILTPARDRYNLAGENQGFADGAPRYLSFQEQNVETSEVLDGHRLLPHFDRATGLGTLRLFGELADGRISNVVCLSRFQGDGYLGKLTEIFNLPYVYGSALLRVDDKLSADAKCGADCAHFIIYGKRRQGLPIPYVNPRDLLPYLREFDEVQAFHQGLAYGRMARGPIQVSPEILDSGLLLHFGPHVAAVFQAGPLSETTRVVHQLETYPQITTLGALARRYPKIKLMTFK